MPETIAILTVTAASIGAVHTLIGPDHYVPFIAMAGAGKWTLRRTLSITSLCGIGHVLGSLGLGALGIALGWALGGLERFESLRGGWAGWLLLGFGLAYLIWGLHRALRRRPHSHDHRHLDGTVHVHSHGHSRDHAHVHADPASGSPARRLTPWVLFTIFIFGPCEPLIPILMYPASERSWWGVALVALAFGLATVLTMLAIVTLGYLGLSRLALGRLERFSHALAGLALVLCGLAIKIGL